MPEDPTKRILWENVHSLMLRQFGEENVSKFAAWSGIGVGSVLRIRAQKTSIGLDILEAIARKARVTTWQLLTPGLDVSNPPMLAPEAKRIRELVANIHTSREALSGLLRTEGNTSSGDLDEPIDPVKR